MPARVIFGFDSSGPLLVVFTADPNPGFTRQEDSKVSGKIMDVLD